MELRVFCSKYADGIMSIQIQLGRRPMMHLNNFWFAYEIDNNQRISFKH